MTSWALRLIYIHIFTTLRAILCGVTKRLFSDKIVALCLSSRSIYLQTLLFHHFSFPRCCFRVLYFSLLLLFVVSFPLFSLYSFCSSHCLHLISDNNKAANSSKSSPDHPPHCGNPFPFLSVLNNEQHDDRVR